MKKLLQLSTFAGQKMRKKIMRWHLARKEFLSPHYSPWPKRAPATEAMFVYGRRLV